MWPQATEHATSNNVDILSDQHGKKKFSSYTRLQDALILTPAIMHNWICCYWVLRSSFVIVYGKTRYVEFSLKMEFDAYFDKLYNRANLRSSLRPIGHFTVELQCFVCDRATPPIIEKLQSKALLCLRMAFPCTTCIPVSQRIYSGLRICSGRTFTLAD